MPERVQHFADLGGLVAEQADELDAVVAHVADLAEHAVQIGGSLFVHGEQLIAEHCLLHRFILP